jgi:hypothetical protein
VTGGELLDGALASEITLVGHTSEGEHSKTTVLQLFDLELVEKLRASCMQIIMIDFES